MGEVHAGEDSALEGLAVGMEDGADVLSLQDGEHVLGALALADGHVAPGGCCQARSRQLSRHPPSAPLSSRGAGIHLHHQDISLLSFFLSDQLQQ